MVVCTSTCQAGLRGSRLNLILTKVLPACGRLAKPSVFQVMVSSSIVSEQYLVGKRLSPATFASPLDILLTHQQSQGLANVWSIAKLLPAPTSCLDPQQMQVCNVACVQDICANAKCS